MMQSNILSEKPEAQLEAAVWAKEVQERIERSDKATQEFKERYTAVFLDNIRKARAGKKTDDDKY